MNWKIAAIVVAVVAVYGIGYYQCNQKWELRYSEFQTESEKKYNDLLQVKIDADKAARDRVYQIETDYLKQIENQKVKYEKDIAAIRADFKPSGVSQCPKGSDSLPGSGGSSTDLICYSKAELQRKIIESVAIGKEADELALKYNALLNLYKGK